MRLRDGWGVPLLLWLQFLVDARYPRRGSVQKPQTAEGSVDGSGMATGRHPETLFGGALRGNFPPRFLLAL